MNAYVANKRRSLAVAYDYKSSVDSTTNSCSIVNWSGPSNNTFTRKIPGSSAVIKTLRRILVCDRTRIFTTSCRIPTNHLLSEKKSLFLPSAPTSKTRQTILSGQKPISDAFTRTLVMRGSMGFDMSRCVQFFRLRREQLFTLNQNSLVNP